MIKIGVSLMINKDKTSNFELMTNEELIVLTYKMAESGVSFSFIGKKCSIYNEES